MEIWGRRVLTHLDVALFVLERKVLFILDSLEPLSSFNEGLELFHSSVTLLPPIHLLNLTLLFQNLSYLAAQLPKLVFFHHRVCQLFLQHLQNLVLIFQI